MSTGRFYWWSGVVFLLLSSAAARGQAPPCGPGSREAGAASESAACGLARRGFRALKGNRPGQAAGLFRKALRRAKRSRDEAMVAEAERGISEAESARGRYGAARKAAQEALGIYSGRHDAAGIAQMHEELGAIAVGAGDSELAEKWLGEAEAEFSASHDRGGLLDVLVDESLVNPSQRGEAELLRRAEALGRQLHDDSALARVAHLRGDIAYGNGDLERALSLYEQAIGLYKRTGDSRDLARVYTSLGRLYRQHNRLALARECDLSALRLQRATGDTVGAVQSLNSIAITYDNEKNWAQSLRYYRRALALARTTGSGRVVRFAEGNLGTAYMEIGQPARAVEILRRVAPEETNAWVAGYRYQSLSKGYLALGRPQEALAAVNKAILLRTRSENRDALVDSLMQRARVLARLGKSQEALADTNRGLKILEGIRAHLPPNDYLKRGFGEETQKVYDVAVRIHFLDCDYRGAAQAGEEGRARAFLDLLAGSGGAPAARGEKGRAGNGLLAPAVRTDSRSKVAPFTASDIAGVARKLNSTILSYWTTEDALYIVTVGPDGEFHGATVRVGREKLGRLIARATSAAPDLTAGGAAPVAAGDDPWRQLDRILIEPVARWLPKSPGSLLTIIPHGPLFGLPFAALRDGKGRYLVERYATHYLPAAAAFHYTWRNGTRAAARKPDYLLVADGLPVRLEGVSLGPLRGAREEVNAIAGIVGARHRVVLRGREARIAAVTGAMREATVVHIASHAVMDDAHPLRSFLVLAPGSAGAKTAGGEGRLTAGAIYGLHIPAGLVVLSACRTIAGHSTGDGLVGISRAFFAAGTASLLATEWDVADGPTSRLMIDFYRRVVAGEGKAQALRQAQLELIAALRAHKLGVVTPVGRLVLPESPRFWAAFVLEGNP